MTPLRSYEINQRQEQNADLFPVLGLLVSIAQVVPSSHIARLQLHGLPVVLHCQLCALHVEVGKAQCIVHLHISGSSSINSSSLGRGFGGRPGRGALCGGRGRNSSSASPKLLATE